MCLLLNDLHWLDLNNPMKEQRKMQVPFEPVLPPPRPQCGAPKTSPSPPPHPPPPPSPQDKSQLVDSRLQRLLIHRALFALFSLYCRRFLISPIIEGSFLRVWSLRGGELLPVSTLSWFTRSSSQRSMQHHCFNSFPLFWGLLFREVFCRLTV